MINPLHILLVEDDQRDVELLIRHLRREGIQFEFVSVDSPERLQEELLGNRFDLILSDYHLPLFGQSSVLKSVLAITQDIPIIFVSGTVGEDLAVELLRQGATDYILKNRLGRLKLAIERAFAEREERQKRQLAEQALHLKSTRQAAAANFGLRAMAAGNIEALLAGAVDLCNRNFDVKFSHVLQWNRGTEQYECPKMNDGGAIEWVTNPYGVFWQHDEWVSRTITYYGVSDRLGDMPAAIVELGIQSALAARIPGSADSCLQYVLCVYDTEVREFTVDDVHFIEMIAHFLTGALLRLQASDALAKSESKFRTLTETSPAGIWQMNHLGDIEYANPAMCRLLEIEKVDSKLPVKLFDFVDPAERERVIGQLNDSLRGVQCEFMMVLQGSRSSQHPVWVALSSIQVETEHSITMGTCVDLTSQKRVEAELKMVLERYDRALRGSMDGIWEWNLPTHEFYFSPGFFDLLGYGDHEDTSRSDWLVERLHPSDVDRVNAALRQHFRDKQPFDIEYRLQSQDGSYRWFSSRADTMKRDDRGRSILMSGSIRDVDERKHLEEQLIQAQKMEAVGRLSGGVAHDFNNLLTVISGYANLIKEKQPETPIELQAIIDAADRASSLTRQLLAFSRKQVIEPRVIHLNELLRNLESMLRRLIGEDIRLKVRAARGLGPIHADPGQIEQIIMNLSVNARDAMPDGGSLELVTSMVTVDESFAKSHFEVKPGQYVLLRVSDSGSGMTQDTIQRAFEPFFTTKLDGRGTGLGLSTVYGIVKQNGGMVSIYSEEGHGCTFKVYFPMFEGVDVKVPILPKRRLSVGSESILLVEDDDSLRKLITIMLEKMGYQVIAAANADRAEELVSNLDRSIDLLLTDVVMPGRNGRILAEMLIAQLPHLRVIFMSGYTADAMIDRGVLNDKVHFIEKPFSSAQLAQSIRDALDR